MKQQSLKDLLVKRRNGTITSAELALLETWYNYYADTAKPFDNPERYITDMQALDQAFQIDGKSRTVKLWPRLVAATVAIMIIGVALFYYNVKTYEKDQPEVGKYANNILPGKQGATLTLANGKKIRLSDAANGVLAKEAGVSIKKTANGQLVYEIVSPPAAALSGDEINTLSTAKGETYQVRLPDGSLVYLNAASSLSYAASLMEKGKRVVRLQGEGYFEVVKDRKHPFIVKTDEQQVEVLGTHFNVKAYKGENDVRTTLLEGAVRVTAADGKSIKIKPGEEALLAHSALTINAAADLEEVVAWKNGYFRFNHESIEQVMQKISRWYDIEVVYEGPVPDDRYNGTISRNKNISQVLKMLDYSKSVHFKVEGRRVTVAR